jgi:metal-sulfur cluster biosynthetic enzyme
MQLVALKFTEVKPLQFLKAAFPIDVTELGMLTEVKPLQYSKAELPIDVTELPMFTEVKLLQE